MDNEVKKIKNKDLGYNDFFESNRHKLKLEEFSVARVIAEYRGSYKVKNEEGEYLAKVPGKKMFDASSREDYPAVGDWVTINEVSSEQAVIHSILPRKTILKRISGDKNRAGQKNKLQIIATNIDEAFVVESVDRDYNLNRFERYFSIANDGGVKPSIILNKIDLISQEELDIKLTQLKNRFNDTSVILTSTLTNDGLNELKEYILSGKNYCFLGSSGVGKSSLINNLLEEDIIKTGDISLSTDRGKHTTTSREMYFLKNGGIVIDNPGMREVGMANIDTGINNLFDEITALATRCKYVDCTHSHEPGCEVLASLKSGKLDKDKYSNYINLKKEVEHYEMTDFEKKKKNRQFGKFLNKTKKEFKKHKHKDY
ncbi:ribosome small subunit-dependent GTPase A [Patescibacteria group bacterium]|nr:ribosome small subunit-dependent GTPase A [Patescibacteria group bacterium]